jgi:hypothetical protein
MHTGIEHCSMPTPMPMTMIYSTAILIEDDVSDVSQVDSSITIYDGGDKDQNE